MIVPGQRIDDDTNGIHPSLLPSTSELLAVVLGLSTVVVYVVAGLGLITFWFWQ